MKFHLGDKVYDKVNKMIVRIVETDGPFYTVRYKRYTPYEQQECHLEKAELFQKRQNRFSKLLNSNISK